MTRIRLSGCVLLWFGLQIVLPAETVNHSWDELVRIATPGKRVQVTRMNLAQLTGKLEGIGDESITIRANGESRVIARADVYRVRPAYQRQKRALWIGLVSSAASAAIWAGVEDNFKGEAAAFGAILGLAGGAAAGAALPLGPPLYQAQSIVRPKP